MDRRQCAEGIRGGAFKILARPHQAAERTTSSRSARPGRRRRPKPAGPACTGRRNMAGAARRPIEKVIWQQEEGVYGKLTQPFQIGEGMCGPTVMAYGSEADKRRYLPKIASGEEIWCQLFSEPAGGSDVAGLRTRAEKRRRSLDHQRPEDLDLGRALFRLRPSDHAHRSQRAQAQGPDHVLPRHEEPGRRGAADQAGQRHAGIQRGLFHRRA